MTQRSVMKTMIDEPEPAVNKQPGGETSQISTVDSPQLQLKTILVPLDFSPASLEALKYAVALAAECGGDIHLVHVQSDDECAAVPQAASLMLEGRDVMRVMQDRLGPPASEHAVHFKVDHCHVLCGRPYREICKLAESLSADVIVLPTRGNSGLKHMVLGSTAERVVRHAKCPVLVARGKAFRLATLDCEPATFSIGSILVPIDFSECSLEGLNYAALLARRFEAKLCLFHAIFPHDNLVMADRMAAILPSLVAAATAAAEAEMNRLKGLDCLRGIACETRIRVGHPVDQIIAQSDGPEFDLVVSATHGRTGFKHAVLGSVAEHLVRYSECPVMVVPARGA